MISEEEKRSMERVAQELDMIWLRDFRLKGRKEATEEQLREYEIMMMGRDDGTDQD